MPGSALTALGPALADPGHIYNTIGEALSRSSNFFINYITVQVCSLFRLWPCHVRHYAKANDFWVLAGIRRLCGVLNL